MAKVVSLCISSHRKTSKKNINRVQMIKNAGLEGDAHAGPGLCQVSLLSCSSLSRMEAAGIKIFHGCCGENVDIDGMELHTFVPGVCLGLGKECILRIAEIGKNNSDGHADAVITGNIFPEEGIFAEVINEGLVVSGDVVKVLRKNGYNSAVLTISDSSFEGRREDKSGPAVKKLLTRSGFFCIRYAVIPDDPEIISRKLALWSDDGSTDLIITTGGTGFSMKDFTPEATKKVCEREVPGIPEMIRIKSSKKVQTAWLSRAVSGIRRNTLIINLPGSQKAVEECMGFVLPVLNHAMEVLAGNVQRCGG